MKKIKFFAAAVCLAISSGVYAQSTNTSSSSPSTDTNTNGWSTIWVEYNPIKIKFDNISGANDESLNGFSAGYSRAFRISQDAPIFLEAGIGLQYANYSDSEIGIIEDYGKVSIDEDVTVWSAKVPVNFLYNFAIPNSSISLAPFVGTTLRYNISGTITGEIDNFSVKYDLFDKKEMNDAEILDGKAWKRFQIGWQIGLKARFGQKIMAGISYGNDFSEIAYKSTIQTTSISIGYTF